MRDTHGAIHPNKRSTVAVGLLDKGRIGHFHPIAVKKNAVMAVLHVPLLYFVGILVATADEAVLIFQRHGPSVEIGMTGNV